MWTPVSKVIIVADKRGLAQIIYKGALYTKKLLAYLNSTLAIFLFNCEALFIVSKTRILEFELTHLHFTRLSSRCRRVGIAHCDVFHVPAFDPQQAYVVHFASSQNPVSNTSPLLELPSQNGRMLWAGELNWNNHSLTRSCTVVDASVRRVWLHALISWSTISEVWSALNVDPAAWARICLLAPWR